MKDIICSILAGIGTGLVYLWGGFDVAMQCLLIAIALDYVSGIIKAFVLKQLSSTVGFRGILKKVGILVVVALAVLIDRVTGESGAIRTLVIYYFVANEGLSIIENAGKAGLPIPHSIKEALQALKRQGDKDDMATGQKL